MLLFLPRENHFPSAACGCSPSTAHKMGDGTENKNSIKKTKLTHIHLGNYRSQLEGTKLTADRLQEYIAVFIPIL